MNRLTREQLAALAASQLPPRSFVNLGIGFPTLVSDHITAASGVITHSENGILHIGPRPAPGAEDRDLINAGKTPVTILPGGSYFDTGLSFAMMRGGHLDIAILGAYQVSARGDIANWSMGLDGSAPPAVGGAMDLAVGAKSIWVLMEHQTKEGASRIVEACTFPLTAVGVVRRIFTDLAVIEVEPDGLVVSRMVDGLTFERLQALTAAPLRLAGSLLA
jgi:3-oxoadipate CoA-transferase, beta subunit